MTRELIDRIDDYAENQDVSRSRAMSQLVEQGLDRSSWDAEVAKAARTLTALSVVGFVVAAVTEDADTVALSRTREPGYPLEDDDAAAEVFADLDRRSAAQYLAHITALEMLADQNEMSVNQTAYDLGDIARALQARGTRFTQLDEEGGPE